MINGELIVDNFAGGGGASTGIEEATGFSVDIAINHDPKAIAMHKANHPNTKHYCEDVWQVDPVQACNGHPVGLAWFSPDCKHFSKAKGGKPKDKNIRGLAWVACRWAGLVRPRVIMLENVEEFKTYWYGIKTGLTAAIAYGVLQLLLDPYILNIPQVLLDYILGFGALGLSGVFSKSKHGLVKGYIIGVIGRFICSFLSGWIFFAVYTPEFFNSAVLYSVVYNGSYIGLEAVVTLVVISLPSVNKALAYVKNNLV